MFRHICDLHPCAFSCHASSLLSNARAVGTTVHGMPGQQIDYVQTAKDNQLTIDSLILMTMNMGGTDGVKDTQTAIAGGISQLASIYGTTTDEATKKLGMLPAIGVDNSLLMVDLSGITTRASPDPRRHATMLIRPTPQSASSRRPRAWAPSRTGTSTATSPAASARRRRACPRPRRPTRRPPRSSTPRSPARSAGRPAPRRRPPAA